VKPVQLCRLGMHFRSAAKTILHASDLLDEAPESPRDHQARVVEIPFVKPLRLR
jgi:hypothetical protein